MTVEEKIFYTEDKSLLENQTLKDYGFKYENAIALGKSDKKGWYIIIKAEKKWFEQEEVKLALKMTEEIKGKEREEILKKLQEIEENVAGGVALFD
jgi:hypothetical protein